LREKCARLTQEKEEKDNHINNLVLASNSLQSSIVRLEKEKEELGGELSKYKGDDAKLRSMSREELQNLEEELGFLLKKVQRIERGKMEEERAELMKKAEKSEEKDKCALCFDEDKSYVCVPCGHVYIGAKCRAKMEDDNCAICRQRVFFQKMYIC